jgi:hypothetical protein
MTRVLVCGGRAYGLAKSKAPEAQAEAERQRQRVTQILDAAVTRLGLTTVIQGGQDGADRWAAEWGFEREIPVATFTADWKRFGKTAGPIRNQRMINEGKPDLVIAFPGMFGTWDMVEKAQRAGIRVIRIDPEEWPKKKHKSLR